MKTSAPGDIAPTFDELDVVRTRAFISVDGHILPPGTLGTIVIDYRNGRTFEVEFAEPVGTLITLEARDFEPA